MDPGKASPWGAGCCPWLLLGWRVWAEYWWVMETPTGPSCQMMVRAEKDVGDGGSRWRGDGGCGELTSKAGGVYD